jgi:dienelactone hydrolase
MKLFICALLIFFGSAAASAQLAQCAGEKTTTLPRAGDYGAFGPQAVVRQVIANPDPAAPAPISVFIPETANSQNKRPVVFFAHGFGGVSYQFYETLMRQLASRGYIVVFSPYSSNLFTSHAARYNQLWNGFLTAVQQNAAIADTTRIGFAGHSYGAGATPEMARRGALQGWGANGLFLFVAAPWYNWGTNMEQVPAGAKMIVQVYWDDATNQHLIGQNDVWNRLPQITERKWQVVRASRTFCSLDAGHSVPVTDGLNQTDGVTNGYDAWAVWRRLDALADYTFTGGQAARDVAFGVDAGMGKWRGLFAVRPIAPLETTDQPIVNAESSPSFTWAAKCLYAQGAPCP